MLQLLDSCQSKVSADQYHMSISQAQVKSSSKLWVFFKFTADQAMGFDWIAGSSLVITLGRVRENIKRQNFRET